jgi:hypothetical protein
MRKEEAKVRVAQFFLPHFTRRKRMKNKLMVLLLILIPGIALLTTPIAADQTEKIKERRVLEGLYAWYPLDGSAENIGPQGSDGFIKGCLPTADRFGKKGGAMYFDGKNDYLTLPLDINPAKLPQLTIALWMKGELPNGIVLSHDNGKYCRSLYFEKLTGRPAISILAGSKGKFYGNIAIPTNNWRMVVAAWDAKQEKAALYTKNQYIEMRSTDQANPPEGFPYLDVGRNPSNCYYFKGAIDEIVIWDRVLSEGEIIGLLTNPGQINPQPRQEALNLFNEGKELFKIGFYDAGVAKFKKALGRASLQIHKFLGTDEYLTGNESVPLQYWGEVFRFHYQQLMAQAKRAKLGVFLEDRQGRMEVTYTFDDLPIYRAGVRAGDVITAVDGRKFANVKDLSQYLKFKSAGDEAEVTFLKGGAEQKVIIKLVEGFMENHAPAWAVYRLLDYGMLAAKAGYPVLTRQAAKKIKEIGEKYPADLKRYFLDDGEALLTALAMAMEEGSDAAYRYLLKRGKFKVSGFYISDYPQYFAPLYQDRKKLAYFLGRQDESTLPKPKLDEVKKVNYIDLNGKLIQPTASVPTLERADQKPQAAPTREPDHGGIRGTVLD